MFEQVYETLPGNGWLSKEEARLLWETAQLTEGPILEVGCHQGRSTVLLASLGRLLYAVDPFDGFDSDGQSAYDAFVRNCTERNVSKVVLQRQRIEDWDPFPCGFCYLDGDHTRQGTIDQIKKALECQPSMIAVHDVNDSGGGLEVKNACLFLLGKWDKRVERLAVWNVRRQSFNVGDADCISPPVGHKA